jgi:hypothetical protein
MVHTWKRPALFDRINVECCINNLIGGDYSEMNKFVTASFYSFIIFNLSILAISFISEANSEEHFFTEPVFDLAEFGEITTDIGEVIEGTESYKGVYEGNDDFNAYLVTNHNVSFLALTTYRVEFDYKIIETPDSGFETIFYSPTGGDQNIWLPGAYFTGIKGDSGRISFTNTLANFDDYQVRWNIVGTGSIVIDNISIINITNNQKLDLSPIKIPIFEIGDKIDNKPTVPIFYPWSGSGEGIDCGQALWFDCDNSETPYSLIWTTQGTVPNLESTQVDLIDGQYARMVSDKDTLYIVSEQWRFQAEGYILPTSSKFYLGEYITEFSNTENDNTFMLNFEHPDWPKLLAEKALNFKNAGFDGIIFDWWHNGVGNGRSEEQVEKARLAISKEIRQKVGDDFIIMGNVNWNTDDPTSNYLSGVFLELWKENPSSQYSYDYNEENNSIPSIHSIERMEDLLKYWDSSLQWPKIVAFEPWKITTDDYIEDRISEENIKFAKLFAAMGVVIPENGYVLYADDNSDWSGGDHQHEYYDFYKNDFGKPVTSMIEVSEGIAYKRFENGLIAYNRTKNESNISFSNGASFPIKPLEGLFLKCYSNADLDVSFNAGYADSAGVNSPNVVISSTNHVSDKIYNISGTVFDDKGEPLCTLVLSNGQKQFTCSGDGKFDLNVRLDGDGKISIYSFSDGMMPYHKIFSPLQSGNCNTEFDLNDKYGEGFVAGTGAVVELPIVTAKLDKAVQNNRYKIAGTVSNAIDISLCALILANGQHMFSCGENHGVYDLNVPLDQNGQVKLYVFVNGMLPYKKVLDYSPLLDED